MGGPRPEQLGKAGAADGNAIVFDMSQTPERSQVQVTAATTTSSSVFAALLTTTVALRSARKLFLLAGFSASASSVLGTPNLFFQLVCNGVMIAGAGPGSAGLLSAAALTGSLGPFLVTGVTGVNTVTLNWRLNTGLTSGLGSVNPTLANGNEFASLYIEEKP
jgi:hypothetical protein